LFAQTAIVSSDGLAIVANQQKLHVVDMAQSIRHACQDVEQHLYGDVFRCCHHFHGFALFHLSLRPTDLRIAEFAALSVLIESGTNRRLWNDPTAIRLSGIPAFDGFSTEITDIIAGIEENFDIKLGPAVTCFPYATGRNNWPPLRTGFSRA